MVCIILGKLWPLFFQIVFLPPSTSPDECILFTQFTESLFFCFSPVIFVSLWILSIALSLSSQLFFWQCLVFLLILSSVYFISDIEVFIFRIRLGFFFFFLHFHVSTYHIQSILYLLGHMKYSYTNYFNVFVY